MSKHPLLVNLQFNSTVIARTEKKSMSETEPAGCPSVGDPGGVGVHGPLHVEPVVAVGPPAYECP